ncbi:MAG: ferritin-like domain-containing protein [Rhodothermales bacterium]|nr:ferritin-like domain-containing protein [Rhodothermales bacterium]
MATPRNLHDLYVHQLKDLYSAETQLIEALPLMAKKASHPRLKQAFETHLDETKRQRERIEQVMKGLDESPKGETCQAMKGIIKEANDFLSDVENLIAKDAPNPVVDAGLIANAQRAEHYEIAGYGTVCYFAEVLGRNDDKRILGQTLQEEKQTDDLLTQIAKEAVDPSAIHANA